MKVLFPKGFGDHNVAGNEKKDDATASTANSSEEPCFLAVDLKLGPEYPPLELSTFDQAWKPLTLEEHMRNVPSTKWDAFGRSCRKGPPGSFGVGSSSARLDQIYSKQDTGLFQCVHEAWRNHWNLRTSPEDWWFPVASRIAKAVAEAAKGCDGRVSEENKKIRDFFVHHQDKKELSVLVDAKFLEDADYDDVFQQFANKLESAIKVPHYAKVMQNDFTTTDSAHAVAAQVNLMASLEEFFEYTMTFCGCGIKSVEMYGENEDWDRLGKKLANLKDTLEPIMNHLWIPKGWWECAAEVFQNLALTRKEPNNPQVIEFWSKVLTQAQEKERGGIYGFGFGTKNVDAYDGWLVQFLTGLEKLRAADVAGTESLSGLNEVPVTVNMTWTQPPISEKTNVIAGMIGFEIHSGHSTSNGVPSLQPIHMWAMLLAPNSKIPRRCA